MRNKLFLLFFVVGVFLSPYLTAQDYVGADKEDFQWRLIGRVFFDGGVIWDDSVTTSFQVNDIRLGARFLFLEDWEAKIELGYADKKISLKDVYLNYELREHSFRLGHHYEPFGNSRVGTTNYRFMTNASADRALGNKRKLGVSYSYNHTWFNFMGGIFSNSDIEKSRPVNQGYSLVAKFVGRPLMADKKLIHIGVAPLFSQGEKQVTYSAGAPTDLLSKDENTYIEADIDRLINQWKLDLELILLYDKWYLQGQYFLAHLNRYSVENYNAQGGYIQAGYMILGAKHNYNARTGMIVNPAPKSLELLCRYDKINLNDAGYTGGKLSDLTVGMNYFLNKYVAAKINYAYVMVSDTAPGGKKDFGLIQARLQFSF